VIDLLLILRQSRDEANVSGELGPKEPLLWLW